VDYILGKVVLSSNGGGSGVKSRRKYWVCSGLRVLAAHDQDRWGVGLIFVGGGHERMDARCGVGSRAVTVGVFLVSDCECRGFAVCWGELDVFLNWVAPDLSGGTEFKLWKGRSCIVYRMLSLRIQ
jgi:hypothetical protein